LSHEPAHHIQPIEPPIEGEVERSIDPVFWRGGQVGGIEDHEVEGPPERLEQVGDGHCDL
jgi:hypothetical protein